ncbi:MAG: hypothetical protein U5K28_07720 [Halobacteriales archaeon]|nr:hypothetical protein [Halobacteriales archaeon]
MGRLKEEIDRAKKSLENISELVKEYRELENRLNSISNSKYRNPLARIRLMRAQESDFLQIGDCQAEIEISRDIVGCIEKKEELLSDIEDDSGILCKSHFHTAVDRIDPYTGA